MDVPLPSCLPSFNSAPSSASSRGGVGGTWSGGNNGNVGIEPKTIITCATFACDSTKVVVGSYDGRVMFFNTEVISAIVLFFIISSYYFFDTLNLNMLLESEIIASGDFHYWLLSLFTRCKLGNNSDLLSCHSILVLCRNCRMFSLFTVYLYCGTLFFFQLTYITFITVKPVTGRCQQCRVTAIEVDPTDSNKVSLKIILTTVKWSGYRVLCIVYRCGAFYKFLSIFFGQDFGDFEWFSGVLNRRQRLSHTLQVPRLS